MIYTEEKSFWVNNCSTALSQKMSSREVFDAGRQKGQARRCLTVSLVRPNLFDEWATAIAWIPRSDLSKRWRWTFLSPI